MNTMGPSGGAAVGGLFLIIWLLMMGGMILGYILFLIALWRGMKAHESVARSLQQIANKPTSV